MSLPDLIAAQLAGSVVQRSKLVEFHFECVPKRIWRSFGKLKVVSI
jgi:hypothetical protein